ncbi:hypothetical protein N7490_011609 [Penicillium lividum]|nr:hypothetical protein N7490_011609 [Penicillium lividum]
MESANNALSGKKPNMINLIVTLANQAGDQGHIAAAMALDPWTDVICLYGDQTESKTVKSAMEHFKGVAKNQYGRQDGPPQFAVISVAQATANIARTYAAYKGEESAQQFDAIKNNRNLVKEQQALITEERKKSNDSPEMKKINEGIKRLNDKLVKWLADQKSVTNHFAGVKMFHDQVLKGMTGGNLHHDAVDASIDRYVQEKKLPPKIQPGGPNFASRAVVILWARYSGGNAPNGHNPDADSSVAGQKQLADIAKEVFVKAFGKKDVDMTCEVVTIGHDRIDMEKTNIFYHERYHLGEFYNDDKLKDCGRLGQAQFLAGLMKCYPEALYRLGQKTGAMEVGALLGKPTLYLEKKADDDGARMKIWAENLAYYDYAKLTADHTYLGKAMSWFDKMSKDAQKEFKIKPRQNDGVPLDFKGKKDQQRSEARDYRMLQSWPGCNRTANYL